MKNIRIIVLFFPLLSNISCGERDLKKGQKSVLIVTEKKKQLNLLNNGKISIDLNKTTSFMKQMEIYGKADEKLEIDLSKTKNMFQ